MSALGRFIRSLIPGDDHQLADRVTAEASAKRRAGHRNGGALRAARQGQTWEEQDRARDRTGRDRITHWT